MRARRVCVVVQKSCRYGDTNDETRPTVKLVGLFDGIRRGCLGWCEGQAGLDVGSLVGGKDRGEAGQRVAAKGQREGEPREELGLAPDARRCPDWCCYRTLLLAQKGRPRLAHHRRASERSCGSSPPLWPGWVRESCLGFPAECACAACVWLTLSGWFWRAVACRRAKKTPLLGSARSEVSGSQEARALSILKRTRSFRLKRKAPIRVALVVFKIGCATVGVKCLRWPLAISKSLSRHGLAPRFVVLVGQKQH